MRLSLSRVAVVSTDLNLPPSHPRPITHAQSKGPVPDSRGRECQQPSLGAQAYLVQSTETRDEAIKSSPGHLEFFPRPGSLFCYFGSKAGLTQAS